MKPVVIHRTQSRNQERPTRELFGQGRFAEEGRQVKLLPLRVKAGSRGQSWHRQMPTIGRKNRHLRPHRERPRVFFQSTVKKFIKILKRERLFGKSIYIEIVIDNEWQDFMRAGRPRHFPAVVARDPCAFYQKPQGESTQGTLIRPPEPTLPIDLLRLDDLFGTMKIANGHSGHTPLISGKAAPTQSKKS